MQSSAGSQPIALDVHAHLVPVALDALAAIEGVTWDAERALLNVDGHSVGIPALYQPEALLAWMERHRVEKAWVSIPPPLYRQQLDADASRRWVDYLNDGLARLCAEHPQRLAPLFHLPVEHPGLAGSIARERTARGARGFSMAAGGSGTPVYSDPALDPLWSALAAADCFVFIHPGACCDGRLKAFYLENLVGNPYETSVAAAHLIFGGVCERFPRVRFCLAHGGGATGMLAARMQHGFATGRAGIDTTREPPERVLRRFHVDSVVHDNEALAFVARTFGPDRVLFGSDWPFPMGVLDPARLEGLEEPLRRRLLWDNPQALRAQYPDHDRSTP
jgi:aminocarboxymuconate-semialdehyde decarboxylase